MRYNKINNYLSFSEVSNYELRMDHRSPERASLKPLAIQSERCGSL